MPLSEFHRAATSGKLESSQNKMISSTSDVYSFMPGQEFVELLWENGGIVMEGQSSRPKKSLNSSSVQEKNGRDAPMEKFGLFSNELSPAVPCANIRLNAQDDDVDPWITNYPMEEPLCSEFFPEFAGINPYSPSTERNNSSTAKGFHNGEHNHSSKLSREDLEPSRFKADKLFRSWQQCQSSVTNTKSRLMGFGFGGGSSSTQQSQFQKQDLASSSKAHQGSNTCGLMNFSHFSRPVSLAKANIESVDKSRSHQKASSTAATTDPTESATLVESRSATKTIHELVPVVLPLQAFCKKDLYRNNPQKNTAVADSNSRLPNDQINHQSSSFGASAAAQRQEAEKGPEAVVASSVCSGNSAGAASNDSKYRGKRKLREGEESGSYSEDLDDELIGVKKPTGGRGGTGTKRSRAAEVHNLSERRRRDRINEKMRALQELIPNCNKVDKASMLDEAIEYLKTLQLQVQMMSMGSGLYMPPMMLQHVRPSPMAHFSPIGLGMGMGLGYGMPMLDMNGSQGFPLVPVPMHTSQLSCASISGTAGLHGMSGSAGLQLLGIPSHGQGLPISMPRPPLLNPLSCLTSMTNSMNGVASATANPLPISDIGPSSRCKDQQQQQQCINSNE